MGETESPDCVSLELCKLRLIPALSDPLAVFLIGEAFPSKVDELFRGAGLASPLAISSAQAGPTDRAATSNRKGKDRRRIVGIKVPGNDGAFRGKRHSPFWVCEPPYQIRQGRVEGLQQLEPGAGVNQARKTSSTGQGPQVHRPQLVQRGHGRQRSRGGEAWPGTNTGADAGLHPAMVSTRAASAISRAAKASAASQPAAMNSSTGSAGAAGVGFFMGSRGPRAAHRPGHGAGRWNPAAAGDGSRLDSSMVPLIVGEGQAGGAGAPPYSLRQIAQASTIRTSRFPPRSLPSAPPTTAPPSVR